MAYKDPGEAMTEAADTIAAAIAAFSRQLARYVDYLEKQQHRQDSAKNPEEHN